MKKNMSNSHKVENPPKKISSIPQDVIVYADFEFDIGQIEHRHFDGF